MSRRVPTPRFPAGLRLLAMLLAVAAGCRGDDPADTGDAAEELAGGSVTVWTDSTELFMEHPALVVGRGGTFAVHLTDITDFAPLRSGAITLRFQPREGGPPLVVTQDAPRRPGIYGPAPVFVSPGLYDLTILVVSPQAHDSITVRGLTVHARADEVPAAPDEADGVGFLKEQQWQTPGFRTAFADSGSAEESFAAPGLVGAAAGRLAEVAAPISALADAASLTVSPVPGQSVTRGQVLAVLIPVLGESGSVLAEARARLREAEDEYQRAERLVAAQAAPARRLRTAQIQRQAALDALAGFSTADSGGRLTLRAPISGTVAQRTIVPGSRVSAGQSLFTLVDASVVWLTVSVAATDAPRVGRTSRAAFTVEGQPRRYDARRVISVGSVIDSVSRTVPVIYEVSNPDRSLRIGALAQVAVHTGRSTRGVVISTAAVLEEDGRPVAWVQADGERFVRRPLDLGARDGDRVLVRAGIRAGERVVTGAAYQVLLALLSTGVPTQGHEH